jgi:DNA polymerase-3 subunit gamma/tau
MGENQTNDYVVLARKYRPRNFGELVGQDALVRTLTNAIKANRLHHAYVLTGIRGVGKTTTARIIAKALNCENGPAVAWSEDDPQVRAITQGTHVDVLEYDAASNRGVEDIAELFGGVNYAPVLGRTKVYIIDEVHMLSTHAFNALLKTLEEPPAKVVFIFATTEVHKIPVTVLSRCMRFDLKRVPAETLARHYGHILENEALKAEAAAVSMVAQAADGSVRDGLSLLDQAIALSDGQEIKAQLVQDMLGLADRAKLYDLLEALLGGQAEAALGQLDDLYARGQDAGLVVQGLLDVVHTLTRLKLVPELKTSAALDELARTRGTALAATIGLPSLSRVYQMLFQAAAEVKAAERPYEALGMAAVRIAYLAPLPPLADLLEKDPAPKAPRPEARGPETAASGETMTVEESMPLEEPATLPPRSNGLAPEGEPGAPARQQVADRNASVLEQPSWADLVARFEQAKPALAAALRAQVRCVGLAGTDVRVQVDKGLHDAKELIRDLRAGLRELTGASWQIIHEVRDAGDAPPTLREQAQAASTARKEAAATEPALQDILTTFPGAVIEGVQEEGRA